MPHENRLVSPDACWRVHTCERGGGGVSGCEEDKTGLRHGRAHARLARCTFPPHPLHLAVRLCVWSTCEHGQNGAQDMSTGVHGISQQTLKIAFRYSSSIDAGIPLMCRSFLAGPPARAPADAAVLSRAPCLLVSSGASMLPCRMPALRKTAATWASRCFGLRAPAVCRCRQAVSMSALARAQAPRGEG